MQHKCPDPSLPPLYTYVIYSRTVFKIESFGQVFSQLCFYMCVFMCIKNFEQKTSSIINLDCYYNFHLNESIFLYMFLFPMLRYGKNFENFIEHQHRPKLFRLNNNSRSSFLNFFSNFWIILVSQFLVEGKPIILPKEFFKKCTFQKVTKRVAKL